MAAIRAVSKRPCKKCGRPTVFHPQRHDWTCRPCASKAGARRPYVRKSLPLDENQKAMLAIRARFAAAGVQMGAY
jgi:ribosomal protein L37AE/L43A